MFFQNTFKTLVRANTKGRNAMKNKRLWILLGGIVLIGAAFLLLDFRVAASNTQTEKLIFTTDMGDNMPAQSKASPFISFNRSRDDGLSLEMVGFFCHRP